MPETHDLDDSLRALAGELDAGSRPTTPAEAMSRASRARKPHARPPRWALVALAVAAVVAVVAVTTGLPDGEDRDDVTTDRTPGPPPAPGPDAPTSGTLTRFSGPLAGTPLASLPEGGFADVTDDGVVLLSYDGTELAHATGWPNGAPAAGADLVVSNNRGSTIVVAATLDPAQAPDDCSEAAGAGGTRVAICDGRRQLDRVDPDGTRTGLSDVLPGIPWTRALPSPDGRWVLAEIMAGCDKPLAVVRPTDPDTESQSTLDDSERVAVGWLPDGRAVMQVIGDGCGSSGVEPSVEALDPEGDGSATLPLSPRGVLHRWRVAGEGLTDTARAFHRARGELGLAQPCCTDQPLNGADLASGLVWHGVNVAVTAGDQGVLPEPDRPGYHTTSVDGVEIIVADDAGGAGADFSCGGTVWHIGGEPLDVTDEATVVAVAEALIPHLYCTVDPLPSG
ncbi:MAG TPA: hypothetical protein VH479_23490 [Acidimicrobiales bacterium]